VTYVSPIAVAGVALLAAPGTARVTVAPASIAAYDAEGLVFRAPNGRRAPMTGFALTTPAGIRIVAPAHEPPWHPVVFGSKVTWSGGSLAAGQIATFAVDVEARSKPGTVTLDADELYPSGAVVRWSVPLKVLPGTKPSEHLGWAAVAAVAGLAATVLFVVVTWRDRRQRPAG